MKLAMQHLSKIDGIGMTQSVMFVIFFAIFLFILYYVYTTKKSYYTGISEMPLDDDTDTEYSRNEIK